MLRKEVQEINALIDKANAQDHAIVWSWVCVMSNHRLEKYDENTRNEGKFMLAWCDECQSYACKYKSGWCRKCQARESGLGNPNVHAKTIKSQLERGTFNMLQPEVQKSKASNKNVKYGDEPRFCEKCKRVTMHKVWKNGKTSCRTCSAANNGQKYVFCEICGEETLYNGKICVKCNPESQAIGLHKAKCVKCDEVTLHCGSNCTVCNGIKTAQGMKLVWCEECQEETYHQGGRCFKCKPWNFGALPNFITKDHVLFYKGVEINEFLKHLDNGKTEIPSVIEKKQGRWCYYGADILTGEKIPYDGFLVVRDGVTYYRNVEVHELIKRLDTGEMEVPAGFEKRQGRWCYNRVDILSNEKILNNNFFSERKGVRYYRNQELTGLLARLDSGEVEPPPGFESRLGRWCYNGRDVLTDGKILTFGASFAEHDNVRLYLDPVSNKYVPWDQYSKDFLNADVPAGLDALQKVVPGSVILPTFRDQTSKSWAGARQAWEELLTSSGIGWFAYIKLYIGKDGLARPLVGGKSGSALVNSAGSDLNFSEDAEDGPARQFLVDSNLEWLKTHVLVVPCDEEQLAYAMESDLILHFHLFGS